MTTPQIPPRPGRSSQPVPVVNEATKNMPSIPPRPARRPDRSVSPARAEYSRSPLNDLPVSHNGDRIYGHYGHNLSSDDLPMHPPARPSSAFHPSTVGEEGVEYGGFDSDASGSPTQTRKVPNDLPIHAPKASVPLSTANARIQTVTRTDSSQAAAAGIGKPSSDTHPLKAKASFSRSNLSLNRPGSSHGTDDEEHGPPSMGLQVPMLKYAGDAQAPSPAPHSQDHHHAAGVAPGRNHHRKHSSRHEFGPPGSYGLHGHGLNSFHGIAEPMDKFDQDWYLKHPEEYLREKGRKYDPGHPSHDWALSSDDLNKLVHQSSSRGLGMGMKDSLFPLTNRADYMYRHIPRSCWHAL